MEERQKDTGIVFNFYTLDNFLLKVDTQYTQYMKSG